MRFTEKSLNALEKIVDLNKVVEALDIDTTDRGEIDIYECPFCECESFVLNDADKATKYYCFECGFAGDAASLIMRARNKSYEETLIFLSVMFNCKLEEKQVDPLGRDLPAQEEKHDVTSKRNFKLLTTLKEDFPDVKISLPSPQEEMIYDKLIECLEHIQKNKGEV